MKDLVRGLLWWPGIDSDIENQVWASADCQRNQKLPAVALLHPWKCSAHLWEHLHIDYAGPVSGKMFLVKVDVHSKWLVVEIAPSATSANIIA